nr:MAG: hypothetical protein DIU56_17230 [Pseudomonadota bacterium]
MPRIRTIKPELAKHELMFDAEIETGLPLRFAWVMLFTVCDREGRFLWRPRTLKSDILPYDDVDFSRVLDAWLTRGFVVRYRVGNAWYGWIPTFKKHQVINPREAASTLPGIDEADEVIDYRNQTLIDASGTREARVDDASPTRHVHARGERKGKEGKGKEGNMGPSDPVEFERSTAGDRERSESIERIFRHWQQVHRHPRARLDGKRRKVIRRALELGYSEHELCECISGYRNSPHHMGQNDRGTVYDEITLFLRDAAHIDAGIRFARAPPRKPESAYERLMRLNSPNSPESDDGRTIDVEPDPEAEGSGDLAAPLRLVRR